MTIIYRAEDGTEFTNEAECLAYENRFYFTSIIFIDKDNNLITYTNPLHYAESERLYNLAERVHILTEKDFEKFSAWAKEFGWCEFDYITSAGLWVREVDKMNRGWWKWMGK